MELSSGACGLFERGEIPTIHDAKDGAPENSIAKTWVTRPLLRAWCREILRA